MSRPNVLRNLSLPPAECLAQRIVVAGTDCIRLSRLTSCSYMAPEVSGRRQNCAYIALCLLNLVRGTMHLRAAVLLTKRLIQPRHSSKSDFYVADNAYVQWSRERHAPSQDVICAAFQFSGRKRYIRSGDSANAVFACFRSRVLKCEF